jgi:cytochrome c peroxidase
MPALPGNSARMKPPAKEEPSVLDAPTVRRGVMPLMDRLLFLLWLLLGALLVLLAIQSASSAELTASVAARFDGAPVEFHRATHTNAAGETLSVTRLDLLLSDFALRRADGSWFERADWQAFLSLGEGRSTFRVSELPAGRFDHVRFRVGVPAELNHADPARFAAGHPLNPNRNGLHWSWQGGYIFLALEGRWSPPGSAGSPRTESPGGFSLHFANDWNLTTVTLPVALDPARDAALALELDLAALLREVSFARDGTSTHSREGDALAARLARALPGAFRATAGGAVVATTPAAKPTRALYLPAKFTPYRFEISPVFPVPDLPRDNPLIEERVALGRALFHEPRLSRDNSISCASCHDERAAFSDQRRFSTGVEGRVGTRHAMPLFNLAWKSSFFWDGRAPTLRAQALLPIQDHAEMDETLERVVAKLTSVSASDAAFPLTLTLSPREREQQAAGRRHLNGRLNVVAASLLLPLPEGEGRGEGKLHERTERPLPSPDSASADYPALFDAAFGSPEITAERIGLALENFLLTLTSFDSKFDRAQRSAPGVTLTEQEQRGFELFFTEYDPRRGQFGADCFHCHGGANFSNHGFANNGLDAAPADLGRYLVTGRAADRGKFAVPSLRNVALTAPYMHDGRFATLEEVVEHYITGVKPGATLDPNLAKHPDGGVPLGVGDKAALVAFLRALTDERFAIPPAAVHTANSRSP